MLALNASPLVSSARHGCACGSPDASKSCAIQLAWPIARDYFHSVLQSSQRLSPADHPCLNPAISLPVACFHDGLSMALDQRSVCDRWSLSTITPLLIVSLDVADNDIMFNMATHGAYSVSKLVLSRRTPLPVLHQPLVSVLGWRIALRPLPSNPKISARGCGSW